jgi:hypothetical protein
MKRLSLLLIFLLCGCATKWQHPSKTEQEFYAELSMCEQGAVASYPPIMQQIQISAATASPMYTSCTGSGMYVSCQTYGGVYSPPQYSSIDVNSRNRGSATNTCLRAKGWSVVK